jgi:DNA-binding XRE family transcriptional regulator
MSTNLEAGKILETKLGPFTFAMYMRCLRDSRGMSQVEMAKFLGVGKSTLCDIEKGRQLVSPALAAKIAKKCKDSIKQAVSVSLRDQLRKAKLDFEVHIA